MKYILSKLFLFATLSLMLSLFVACNEETKPEQQITRSIEVDPNFHVYLCFGQSNMEGSAKIQDQDTLLNERFLAMQTMDCDNSERKKGEWFVAQAPLSQCYVGLSPADYFGKTMVEKLPKDIKIGVINVAVGGCDIRLFDKEIYQDYDSTYVADWFLNKIKAYGGSPYHRLIELAKEAQKTGVIKGILLHQGETNNGDENWPSYVKTIYTNMLNDLSLKSEEVPLLAGELAHEDQNGKIAEMNSTINTLPDYTPNGHVISSSGCKVSEDLVHFNSEGVRELGKRYAEKMIQLQY